MLEEGYIVWHEGQSEADGKELKAASIKAAAKKGFDIFRHERIKEYDSLRVFVKDKDEKVHEVEVSASDENHFPEAQM